MISKFQAFNNRIKKIYTYIFSIFIYVFLITKGYKNVSAFKVKSWHKGYFYFKARDLIHGDVFIKGSLFDSCLRNEEYFSSKINCQIEGVRIPDIYKTISFSFSTLVFIQFLKGTESLNEVSPCQALSIYRFILYCNENDIILRDLKKDNILTDGEVLYFIDFTYAHDRNPNKGFTLLENQSILSDLGREYRPDNYVWDDFYSLLILGKELSFKHDLLLKIEKSIGRFTVDMRSDYVS